MKSIRDFFLTIAAEVIIYFIIRLLDATNFVNSLLGIDFIYILIGIGIIAFVFFIIGGTIKGQKTKRNGRSIFAIPQRPKYNAIDVKIKNKFGVSWKAVIGTASIFGEEPYAYVDGAYCPRCDCELDTKYKNVKLGWSQKRIWRCPQCGFEHDLPDESIIDLYDSIGKIAMNYYNKETNGK